jgi:transcriptional regulator of heat shock response
MPKKRVDPETGLTIRQRNLLFAVVKEYCEFGNTVSSHDLKEKYGFNISSATIRNEFTILRNAGYLYQPFTNASSQPTEMAFKMFINQMLTGLQVTTRQQQELRGQILELEQKHMNLQKEISKLLALETKAVGFAVNMEEENIAGIKNLLSEPGSESGQISDILDFLENLDKHKQFLLEHKKDNNLSLTSSSPLSLSTGEKGSRSISTIFGDENPVFPIGKGYAMVATEAFVNNQKTVFGIITQPHILGRRKTLQIIDAVSRILNDNKEENKE